MKSRQFSNAKISRYTVIYQEVEDPRIGGFILEIAGYVQETRPESPPVSAFNILSKLFIFST